MSGRWQELRATFKAKNRDLDAEFEKFLNEVSLLVKTEKFLVETPADEGVRIVARCPEKGLTGSGLAR